VSGYVERRYKSCPDDGGPKDNADQCWAGDNATMSPHNGTSTELVRDDASGVWKLKRRRRIQSGKNSTGASQWGQ